MSSSLTLQTMASVKGKMLLSVFLAMMLCLIINTIFIQQMIASYDYMLYVSNDHKSNINSIFFYAVNSGWDPSSSRGGIAQFDDLMTMANLKVYGFDMMGLRGYCRSYVVDERVSAVRFLVEMPFVFLNKLINHESCRAHCAEHNVPYHWMNYVAVQLVGDSGQSVVCSVNVLTTSQRVWHWKLTQDPLYWNMTRDLTHAEVFIECPWHSEMAQTVPYALQFLYVFDHNYLMGIDSNITELLSRWRAGYTGKRRKFIQQIELTERMRIDQGPSAMTTTATSTADEHTVALCVSSLFHSVQLRSINSFFEHYLSSHFEEELGVRFHLFLYLDYNQLGIAYNASSGEVLLEELFSAIYINQKVQELLRRHIDKKVFFVEWNANTKHIYYGSQVLSINDCLYRNQRRYRWILRYDSDEFLIVKNAQNGHRQFLRDLVHQSMTPSNVEAAALIEACYAIHGLLEWVHIDCSFANHRNVHCPLLSMWFFSVHFMYRSGERMYMFSSRCWSKLVDSAMMT